MIARFVTFIEKEGLVRPDDMVLLGVSGGLDSVAMTDLFARSNYSLAIAHCNFRLRGEESDEDERFVAQMAFKYGVPFFVKRFDTAKHARTNGISVQMAARDLRRQWMEDLCKENSYACYATAHHLDDEIETFFINLSRGTGFRGLSGYKPREGRLIHPLLFAFRKELAAYAAERKLAFREDSSNALTDYTRNRFRHLVIPLLEELIPSFRSTMIRNIERFREGDEVIREKIDEISARLTITGDDLVCIPKSMLEGINPKRLLLTELLKPYHFNAFTVDDIAGALTSQPGKMFFSPTHQLILDRKEIIIRKTDPVEEGQEVLIDGHTSFMSRPFEMSMKVIEKEALPELDQTRLVACLDYDLLKFPLRVRRWKKGDYFYPLGMKGRKKISDFFVDQKWTLFEKDRAWLLTSGGEVAWIIGHRVDDRFKVTDGTTTIYQITMAGPAEMKDDP
jgi:tRNA(Ile)-lysidine synthase